MNKSNSLFIAFVLLCASVISANAQHNVLNYNNLNATTKSIVDNLNGGQSSYLLFSNNQWIRNREFSPVEAIFINNSNIQALSGIAANHQNVEMIIINLDINNQLDANAFSNFSNLDKVLFTSYNNIDNNTIESVLTNISSSNTITFIYYQISDK